MMRTGFSLIEVLISLCITVFIVSSMGHMIASLLSLRTYAREHASMVDLAVALSRWSMDVHSARSVLCSSCCTADHSILKLSDLYCGWYLREGRLMRYVGTYCSSSDTWKGRSTSMVMASLDSLVCRLIKKQGQIVALELTLCRGKSMTFSLVSHL